MKSVVSAIMMVLAHREQVMYGGVVGHRYLRFGLSSMNDQLDIVIVPRQVPNIAWAIIEIHVGLVRSRPGLENEITHKNVQKKVKCDPCAISSCETNLVCEGVLGHEREYCAFG